MATYADANRVNFNPEYRYQKPEHGMGQTPPAKNQEAGALPRDDRDALEVLQRELETLILRQ